MYFLVKNYPNIFKIVLNDESLIEEEILLIETLYQLLEPIHLFAFLFN